MLDDFGPNSRWLLAFHDLSDARLETTEDPDYIADLGELTGLTPDRLRVRPVKLDAEESTTPTGIPATRRGNLRTPTGPRAEGR
jgi:hypothetical protein